MQRSIRFPDELDAKIAKLAEADDRSFSYVVLRELEKALSTGEVASAGSRPVATSASPTAPPRTPESELAADRRARQDDAWVRQQQLNKAKGLG